MTPEATKAIALLGRPTVLSEHGKEVWRTTKSRDKTAPLYEASIVLSVASWEGYLEGVTTYSIQVIRKRLKPKGKRVLSLLQNRVENDIKRFNTPNSENARSLLIDSFDYDPWPDWKWSRGGLSSLQMRQRMNDYLLIRHTIAHGAQLPPVSFLLDSSGSPRLTYTVCSKAVSFFKAVITATDAGLASHIDAHYPP